MTNSELEQAQEWADKTLNNYPFPSYEGVAARLIQSLPDQWIDAEKLREALDGWSLAGKALRETDLGKRLEALLPANLPTLADMTPGERAASQFMQARLADGTLGIIVHPDDLRSSVISKDGGFFTLHNENITPLQGELKLKWPGSEPHPDKVSLSDMWVDDGSSPVDALKLLADEHEELDQLKPEDVPADELWLVEYYDQQWIGKRNRNFTEYYPWRVASVNGEGSDMASDSQITLIHKLVPEIHTLPKGMRLADHEKYGRVVVSPKMDSDSEYKVTHSDPAEDVYGIDWQYIHESKLAFLDGE